jgi:hypothetical protein
VGGYAIANDAADPIAVRVSREQVRIRPRGRPEENSYIIHNF